MGRREAAPWRQSPHRRRGVNRCTVGSPAGNDAGGFHLDCPVGWRAYQQVQGCALVLVEPSRTEPQAFCANLTVTVSPLEENCDAVLGEALALLDDHLTEHRLIDLESVDVAGLPGHRILSIHTHECWDLTLEQWLLSGEAMQYTLSATAESLDYPAYAGVLRAVIASFAPMEIKT